MADVELTLEAVTRLMNTIMHRYIANGSRPIDAYRFLDDCIGEAYSEFRSQHGRRIVVGSDGEQHSETDTDSANSEGQDPFPGSTPVSQRGSPEPSSEGDVTDNCSSLLSDGGSSPYREPAPM